VLLLAASALACVSSNSKDELSIQEKANVFHNILSRYEVFRAVQHHREKYGGYNV
jgi:hypothetical protein